MGPLCITDFKTGLLLSLQLLDLPGIIEGAKDGKGRGRQVIAVARTCSLIFIVLDVLKPLVHKKLIEKELEGFGLRLNKQPPNIVFRKKDKGGINLQVTVRIGMNCLQLPAQVLALDFYSFYCQSAVSAV